MRWQKNGHLDADMAVSGYSRARTDSTALRRRLNQEQSQDQEGDKKLDTHRNPMREYIAGQERYPRHEVRRDVDLHLIAPITSHGQMTKGSSASWTTRQ